MDTVKKPKDEKVTNSQWVFTKKLNPDRTDWYKTRIVIRLHSQQKRIYYSETFSVVVRFDKVRLNAKNSHTR